MVEIVSRTVLSCAYQIVAQIEDEVLGPPKGYDVPVVRILNKFPSQDRVIGGIPIHLDHLPGSASFVLSSTDWRLECHPDFLRDFDPNVDDELPYKAHKDRSWCYDGHLEGDEDAFNRDFMMLMLYV